MSLKRYALIAAVSYHNNNHNHTTTTSTTTTTIKSQQQQQLLQNSTAIYVAPTTTTTASMRTTNPAAGSTQLTAGAIDGSSNNNNTTPTNNNNNTSSTTTGSAIPTYYGGGLGLFHQQNIRANSGASGGGGIGGSGLGLMNGGGGGSVNGAAGSSYPNAINGNVNLLLGGAMLSLITTMLCVVCYCCHRNIKKRTEAAYRQQRQWLENDPNMEIYSVEQCYETSGLFLGESTDGLATLPTLHHEPPPSYDAVVAMQEQQLLQQQQQQQQLLLLELEQQQQQHQHQIQRNSPPPGYRSTLDVSGMFAMAACSSRGTPDGRATSDSNGNLSGVTGSQQKSLNGVNSIMNMKKVLSAQSCCSLQRAEVENMWNAAAAAVAARAVHSSSSAATATSATTTTTCAEPVALTLRTPTAAMARKSLPAYAGAKLSVNEFGRRYLNQNYYRRGCPLCGKFCYNEGENEGALSLSTESLGLDNLTMPTTGTEPRAAAASADKRLLPLCCRDDCNNGNNGNERNKDGIVSNIANNSQDFEVATRNQISAKTKRSLTAAQNGNDVNANVENDGNDDDDDYEDGDDNEACSCTLSKRTDTTRQRVGATATGAAAASNKFTFEQQQQQPHDENANENNDENGNSNGAQQQQSIRQQLDMDLEATNYAGASDVREFVAAFASNEATLVDNNNANPAMSSATTTAEVTTSASSIVASSILDSAAESSADTPTTSTLDSINENGIIRLDMSKIIDRTGLPTYEAALKLESSGYV